MAETRVEAFFDRFANAEQVPEEIAAGAVFAEMGAELAARGKENELDGGEIIFGVRVSEAVGCLLVVAAVNAWDAVCVAGDGGVVVVTRGGERGRRARGDQRERCKDYRESHVFPPPSVPQYRRLQRRGRKHFKVWRRTLRKQRPTA